MKGRRIVSKQVVMVESPQRDTRRHALNASKLVIQSEHAILRYVIQVLLEHGY